MRKSWIGGAIVLVVLLCAQSASAAAYACVASATDAVPLIDTEEYSAQGSLDVGTAAHSIVANPAGTRLYVTHDNDGKVTVIDAATRRVITDIDTGSPCHTLAVSPDGSKIYATHRHHSDQVTVIDAVNNRVEGGFRLGADGIGIAINPSGQKAYAGYRDRLAVIDTAQSKVTDILRLPSGWVTDVAFDPQGQRAYAVSVRNFATMEGTLIVIDARTDEVLAEIGIGRNPWGVEVSPDGGTLYAVSNYDSCVSVIDAESWEIVRTIRVSSHPYRAALMPDGKKLLVASYSGGCVDVIDTQNNRLVDSVPVAGNPYEVAVASAEPSENGTIRPCPEPRPTLRIEDFQADKRSGPASLKVHFTSKVEGAPVKWQWNFEQVKRCSKCSGMDYVFRSAGDYDVTLTVTDARGQEATLTKRSYIHVYGCR